MMIELAYPSSAPLHLLQCVKRMPCDDTWLHRDRPCGELRLSLTSF